MTQPLDVDTDQLRRASASFTSAGEQMAGLHADAPLADAAAAVPQLRTAAACHAASATVAAEMASIAGGARAYAADLRSTADEYDATDAASAADVDSVDVPPPAPR